MLPQQNIDKDRVIPALDLSGKTVLVPSLLQSKRAIYGIDFTMLIHKLCQPDPNISRLWSQESATDAILLYKNWLWIIRKYGNLHPVLPPSTEIDEMWHHHILDTYKYQEDCRNIFGQFFHHYPYFGMRGASDHKNLTSAFEVTQRLYHQEFGHYIPEFEECEEEIHMELSA